MTKWHDKKTFCRKFSEEKQSLRPALKSHITHYLLLTQPLAPVGPFHPVAVQHTLTLTAI